MNATKILRIDASMRHTGSVTRALTDKLVARLRAASPGSEVTRRDLADGVPLVDEAWIDMIARARETFRYTETGPEGLMTGKRALVVVASGGVPVGSAADFATP